MWLSLVLLLSLLGSVCSQTSAITFGFLSFQNAEINDTNPLYQPFSFILINQTDSLQTPVISFDEGLFDATLFVASTQNNVSLIRESMVFVPLLDNNISEPLYWSLEVVPFAYYPDTIPACTVPYPANLDLVSCDGVSFPFAVLALFSPNPLYSLNFNYLVNASWIGSATVLLNTSWFVNNYTYIESETFTTSSTTGPWQAVIPPLRITIIVCLSTMLLIVLLFLFWYYIWMQHCVATKRGVVSRHVK